LYFPQIRRRINETIVTSANPDGLLDSDQINTLATSLVEELQSKHTRLSPSNLAAYIKAIYGFVPSAAEIAKADAEHAIAVENARKMALLYQRTISEVENAHTAPQRNGL